MISKFTVGATLADTAASEQILIEVPQPFSNHNGGQIAFGPDGYLYIGMGDGGSGGDPLGNGQNLTSLLGALLRVDVNNQDKGLLYAIPPDNPSWSGVSGARREIWAYGLRNPWRFSFDPLTGFLYLGDVGQNSREEIDIIRKGLNYGWNEVEGDICFLSNCVLSNFEPPLIAHTRSEMFAITGGLVYRGSQISDLCGVYVYGDFGTGIVKGLRYDGTKLIEHRDLMRLSNPSSFGYDENHEVYAVDLGDGTLYKVSAP